MSNLLQTYNFYSPHDLIPIILIIMVIIEEYQLLEKLLVACKESGKLEELMELVGWDGAAR